MENWEVQLEWLVSAYLSFRQHQGVTGILLGADNAQSSAKPQAPEIEIVDLFCKSLYHIS